MEKLIAIVIVLLLIYLRVKSIKSVYKKVKIHQFPKYIEKLMIEIKGNGSLFIENNGTEKCIVLNKYNDQSRVFLNLAFPIASWSFNYVTKFQELLNSEQIQYSSMEAGEEAKSFIKGYVIVPDLPNVALAQNVAQLAIKSIDIQPDASFTLRYIKND